MKPLLKWAGGKTQLLNEILPKIPKNYGRFIEPFIGGGAVFFAVKPTNGIISDSNPELINLYRSVANNVDDIIFCLKKLKNTEEFFYKIRSINIEKLSDIEAAARTIFLNKTCFNGLYRVNKIGHFNVPFGRYKNPKIIDEEALRAASSLLKKNTIICGDYKTILRDHAKKGDFIFLDPPYLPISQYSDFKRYTKEQFIEKDHYELEKEVRRLHKLGCHIILTNSNHPIVHEQYKDFSINIIQTKRHLSCNGNKRTGEDIIVNIPPKIMQPHLKLVLNTSLEQTLKYPSTRYMGSKSKLLPEIWDIASQFKFDTVLDLFSGSGIVGYMFKSHGKTVISNDYMNMSATFAKAMIENNEITLPQKDYLKLIIPQKETDNFVQTKFKDLYFSDYDNQLIDIIRTNIKKLRNPYKRSIAMSALIRACLKKRPRGIFTYIGQRYDDGRKDLVKSLQEHFFEAIEIINLSIFNNERNNKSRHGDAMTIRHKMDGIVYMDPPYYSPLSDNEYVRRYHFVEGLARDWQGVEIQENTKTKKFKSYPTPFSSRDGATNAFNKLFKKFQNNILMVSYSSNSQPTLEEMISILKKYKKHVDVIPVDYKYSIGNQGKNIHNNKNSVKEYIFVAY